MLLVPRLSNPDPGKDFLGREALSERSLGRSEEKQRGGEMEGRAQEGGWMGRRSMIQVVQGRIKESDFTPCEVGATVEF